MEKKEAFIENIIEKPLERVLPDSMMPYSEYVILDRALPRVEDGLKPVQRRILYAMYDMNMKPDSPYKKSARVVGECLGKYHPHGDKSVYDAMVRMAQDFNMRMPLVDGHGNFGSIDGDPAAAMRYTEVRLQELAMEMLRDIEKGTVKWNKNFDDTLEEPDVLPGRFPNLLVNGCSGIAIGLATNIPPHNLSEVIDGCIALIDQPAMKLENLVKIVRGPDFPTGGFMLGGQNIIDMYENGHGKLVVRAKTDIELAEGGARQNIIISEIPYTANKEQLQKRIFDLRESKKDILGNITDVSDESDKKGMRIVIKLKRGEDAVKVLNYLITKTDLESNYNANMVAIADGRPMQMGLLAILKYYLNFQKSIVLKRSQHDLNIAKKREHILEGYTVAIPEIDEVIRIIRSSASRTEARNGLRARFNLSEAQADAVLSLQLGNINKLDVCKFEKELKELRESIEKLNKIIGSSREQMSVVKRELLEIKNKYQVKRKTIIVDSFEDVEFKSFDATQKPVRNGAAVVGADGGVKFVSSRLYMYAERDVESGGYDGLSPSMAKVNGEDITLVFTSLGNCGKITDAFKEKRWDEKGDSLSELYNDAAENERAVKVMTFTEDEIENKEIYIFTKYGYVKRTKLKQLMVNKDFYQVTVLKNDDEVIGAELAEDNSAMLFVTTDGLLAATETSDYSLQGRVAGGVIGANLNDGESVVYAGQAKVELGEKDGKDAYLPLGEVVVITSKGYAKRVLACEFEPMKRGRKGTKLIELTDKVIFAHGVLEPFKIAIAAEDGALKELYTDDIRIDARTSKGKPIVFGLKISKVVKHNE